MSTEADNAVLQVQLQEALAQNQQLASRLTMVESAVGEIKATINSFKKWIQAGVIAAIIGIGGGTGGLLLNKSGDADKQQWMRDAIQIYLQAQGAKPAPTGP